MSVLEAQRVTLADFEVMTEAHMLRRVDNQFDMHLQAWLNNQVKATNSSGKKPYFDNFSKFFDYEKAIESVKGSEEKLRKEYSGGDLYKKLNQLNKGGE